MGRRYLVQRWHTVMTRDDTGRLVRRWFTENATFDTLPEAVSSYRRSADGLWAHPSWETWGVTSDPEVVAEADLELARVPMPAEVREALARLTARLGAVDSPPVTVIGQL